jgi:hypothetical protein
LTKIDKVELLKRLPTIEPEKALEEDSDDLRQMSLSSALLMLAEIDHEHEYQLCRSVAQHLLGEAREPEDIELEE